MEVDWHYIKDEFEQKIIAIMYISSNLQLVDLFNKSTEVHSIMMTHAALYWCYLIRNTSDLEFRSSMQ